jgi:hypothetical protein
LSKAFVGSFQLNNCFRFTNDSSIDSIAFPLECRLSLISHNDDDRLLCGLFINTTDDSVSALRSCLATLDDAELNDALCCLLSAQRISLAVSMSGELCGNARCYLTRNILPMNQNETNGNVFVFFYCDCVDFSRIL